jgi:hypothetical protein
MGGEGRAKVAGLGEELKTLGDAMLHLGKSSRYQVQYLREQIRDYSTLRAAQAKGTQAHRAMTKGVAANVYELRKVGLQSAAASLSFRDLAKSEKVVTGISKEEIDSRRVAIAGLVGPSDKMFKAMNFLSPEMAKSTQESTNAAANFQILAGALGGVAILGKFIYDLILGVAKGTARTATVLGGAVTGANVSLGRSSEIFVGMNLAGAQFGASLEEQMDLLKGLTSSYALNASNIDTLTGATGGAAIQAYAMAKAFDVDSGTAVQLISTMRIFGTELGAMPDAMADVRMRASQARLTMTDMAKSVMLVTNTNMLASKSHLQHMMILQAFGRNVDNSLKPLMAFADKSAVLALHAKAMAEFSRMAASMPMPEWLAFGGGLKPGGAGNLAEAMKSAVGTGKGGVLFNMAQMIMGSIQGTSEDQIAGLAAYFNLQKGVELDTAYDLAHEIAGMRKAMIAAGAVTEDQ